MAAALKAFKVTDHREEHSVLVLAEKRSKAIADAVGELNCGYREARAVRAPEFDGGIPDWRELVEHHGWYRECRNCDAHVFGDDMNDGGLFDDDDEAWCRKCGPKRAEILQRRADEVAYENDLKTESAAQAKAKWPFAEVLNVSINSRCTNDKWCSYGFGGFDAPRPPRRYLPVLGAVSRPLRSHPWPIWYKSPVVTLRVPGCRWSVTWEPRRDPHHVEVYQEDVDAWHAAKAGAVP